MILRISHQRIAYGRFARTVRAHEHMRLPFMDIQAYIVKYLMTQMDGDITLQNMPDGLLAKLMLPIEKKD